MMKRPESDFQVLKSYLRSESRKGKKQMTGCIRNLISERVLPDCRWVVQIG
jgi:hypothetical protein